MSAPKPIETVHGIRRVLYWVMAGLFFALAMIGVVLPGIPTTPFLLLMCYFLIRVSPSLHAKAMCWPVVGGPLRDWRNQGGVRPSVKVLAITMVVMLVGTTLGLGNLPIIIKAIIFLAAAYGVHFVRSLPTAQAELVRSNDLQSFRAEHTFKTAETSSCSSPISAGVGLAPHISRVGGSSELDRKSE